MQYIASFLDRAKAGAGIESDYALAKLLDIGLSRVSNWRRGANVPDERAIEKLCELSGDDLVEMLVDIESLRAANDDTAGLWRQVAERLKSGGQNVLVMAFFAAFFIANINQPADAATAPPSFDAVGVCILCRIAFSWILRIGRLIWIKHQTGKSLTCNSAVTA